MKIIAIDPGNVNSGWVLWHNGFIVAYGIDRNEDVLRYRMAEPLFHDGCELAIEMMKARGMPVSNDEMETLVWIGRFKQAWPNPDTVKLVYRGDVKMHVCGNMKANDKNIRAALIDLIGKPGTKKNPGPTFGITSHVWQALAVAVTLEGMR